jgi:hypothetical protein
MRANLTAQTIVKENVTHSPASFQICAATHSPLT